MWWETFEEYQDDGCMLVRECEDKDHGDSLPACYGRISSRRSRCAKISAVNTKPRRSGGVNKRGLKQKPKPWRKYREETSFGLDLCARYALWWRGPRERQERRMERKANVAMNDRNQRNTDPAKIAWNTPGIYYPHGCSDVPIVLLTWRSPLYRQVFLGKFFHFFFFLNFSLVI